MKIRIEADPGELELNSEVAISTLKALIAKKQALIKSDISDKTSRIHDYKAIKTAIKKAAKQRNRVQKLMLERMEAVLAEVK